MDKRDLFQEIYNDFWGEETQKEIEQGAQKKKADLGALMASVSSMTEELLAAGKTKKEADLGALMTSVSDIKEEVLAENKKEAEDQEEAREKEQKVQQATEEKKQEPEEDPMETLNNLVGLTALKDDVKELINLIKIQKMREEKGLKTVPVSLHLVFTGNPGTGKTTVARILAKLYQQIGALPKGQLVEVDRSMLVAGFVGQTATKTQDKIKEAMGGILFIDEAYTLVKDGGNDFGQEAIDTILKAMEDHRDELVVIVAGYPDLMEKFINSNPGLKSRFNKYLYFPDYSVEELKKIFDGNCKKYDYVLTEEAQQVVTGYIEKLEQEKDDNFANARSIRNLFENIITNQASRVAQMEDPQEEDMKNILPEDIEGYEEFLKDTAERKEEIIDTNDVSEEENTAHSDEKEEN